MPGSLAAHRAAPTIHESKVDHTGNNDNTCKCKYITDLLQGYDVRGSALQLRDKTLQPAGVGSIVMAINVPNIIRRDRQLVASMLCLSHLADPRHADITCFRCMRGKAGVVVVVSFDEL